MWRSIVDHLELRGSQNEFVSVVDMPRATFAKHPWSIGGGGATELKEQIERAAEGTLVAIADSIGITCFTLEDEVYILPSRAAERIGISQHNLRSMVVGDSIRDWGLYACDPSIFPYNEEFVPLVEDRSHPVFKHLNIYRTCLANNKMFGGKTKVDGGIGGGIANEEWERFFEHTSAGLSKFPVPTQKSERLPRLLDHLSRKRQIHLPAQLIQHLPLSRAALDDHQARATALLGSMIALQEELDWRCYTLYGLTDQALCYRTADGEPLTPPEITLGQRAFEIVMARQMAAGELQTTWFERHHATPITELPDPWPDDYKRLVERRIAHIESDHAIHLIEQPEYKRRWNLEPWDEQEKRALRSWLLDRAEVAASLTRHQDETEAQFQARLSNAQRRRKQDDIGDMPPPPKYRSTDFLNATCWRLRGALDVPKERFISYPLCSREADPALLIGWAGWDHLQQAQALAAWYTEVVEQEGWPPGRLKPLLLGLAELLPWLKQWHNDIDPDYNERMGDFFAIFLQGQLQQHGLTCDDLHTWQPPATSRRRGKRQRT